MKYADRFKLLHGPYRVPRLRRGDRTTCLFRDTDVVITGMRDARISWPLCRAIEGKGAPGILVDEEMLRAVRHEAPLALRYWFGISKSVVRKWRRTFGVERYNQGSARLQRLNSKAGAAVIRGKEVPAERTARQMKTRRERGNWTEPPPPERPWTNSELQLVGADTDVVIAAKIGRTRSAVRSRRLNLGLAAVAPPTIKPRTSKPRRRKRYRVSRMSDDERFKLLHGPYRPPRFRLGQILRCGIKGEVKVTRISNGPIRWPMTTKQGGKPSIILCGSLVKAAQRESEQAICHWWGVGASAVRSWRRALGVPAKNEGTMRLQRDYFSEPWAQKAREKAWAKARDPERCAKIAASLRGKPRPRHVTEAMTAARLGKPLSAETRSKMSEAHRRRGTRPPKAGRAWTSGEDALLGTMPDENVARLTKRTLAAVELLASITADR